MKEITVIELKNLKDSNADFQLIDVREADEVEICEIGGEHIPMAEVMDNLEQISTVKQVIIHCRSGARSGAICNALESKGYTNVYNLKGGILAWATEIDPSFDQFHFFMSLHDIADFFLHLDVHLENIMFQYQATTYFILCLIIFCETGLVATPFLPGDSLLFAAGAIIAKTGLLNVWLLIPLLFASAIIGDNLNYFVGRFVGHKVLEIKFLKKIIKKEYLDRTHKYYEKHGGKTIIMARFVPIITFAPFVAGVGEMNYMRYITFSVIGGITWVTTLTLAGYYLGGIPIVKDNFEIVVLGIIGVSVLPVFFQLLKAKFSKAN